MDPQLSKPAQEALNSRTNLPQSERSMVLAQAAKIAETSPTSTPETLAEASSVLAAAAPAISTTHGFRQVIAPDGKAAVEVEITRAGEEKVTCLLSEGAKGKSYQDLAGYGKDQLKGVTLLTHEDFNTVVESLYNAIRGQKVVGGVLETEDAALRQAHQIVTQGVRRHGGFSWAAFALDGGGAVAGRLVHGFSGNWHGHDGSNACALFGASPAE